MNRLDELTLKFADSTLTEIEAEELLSLIEADPAALAQHTLLLEVEFALRETFAETSLAGLREYVMARVDQEHRTVFTERTMTQIRATPPPSRPLRRRKSPAPWAGVLAMAAALVLIFTIAFFLLRAEPQPVQTGAWLSASNGHTTVLRTGETITITGKAALHFGDVIHVEDGLADVTYSTEATHLTLTPGTTFQLLAADTGKHFLLTQGAVEASVSPQPAGMPLIIQTPATTATVKGTIFRLTYLQEKAVLAVTEGAVEFASSKGGKTLVEAGRIAEILPGGKLIENWINEPQGLVSRWTFDEANERIFADIGAVHNPAKLQRNAVLRPGVSGQAISFDGEHQYVEIPHEQDYELTNGSVAFWFKSDQPRRGMSQMLFTKRTRTESIEKTAGFTYISIDERGQLHAQIYGHEGKEISVLSQTEIQPGQWNHAVLTFGQDGMKLYLNGKLQGSDPHAEGWAFNDDTQPNREAIILGADNAWPKRKIRNYFRGELDDLRIYNRSLSPQEVQQLAQAR